MRVVVPRMMLAATSKDGHAMNASKKTLQKNTTHLKAPQMNAYLATPKQTSITTCLNGFFQN